MKVIVDFSKDKELIGSYWIEDVLAIQEEEGFISVIKSGCKYCIIDKRIQHYLILQEWIKEVIK